MRGRGHYRPEYKPPAKDSEQAKANATLFLFGCTDERFAALMPAKLAADYRLSERQAEYMITVARQKRQATYGL